MFGFEFGWLSPSGIGIDIPLGIGGIFPRGGGAGGAMPMGGIMGGAIGGIPGIGIGGGGIPKIKEF